MPLPAVVSIMHRISGAALFLALPVLLCWWQSSLASFQTFAEFKSLASLWFVKLAVLALLWGYLHHLCAGLRHLAMDVDIGTELATARLTSRLVMAVGIALTLVIGACLW